MQEPKRQKKISIFWIIILFIVVSIGVFYFISKFTKPSVYEYKNYGELIDDFKNGRIYKDPKSGRVSAYIKDSGVAGFSIVYGRFTNDPKNKGKFNSDKDKDKFGKTFKFTLTLNQYNKFYEELKNEKIQDENKPIFEAVPPRPSVFGIILQLLPIILIGALIILMIKKMRDMQDQGPEISKTSAKLSKEKAVGFDDVAGADEEKQELVEVIDFLKNPKKYRDIGARIPKGILLVGPPGTGKTLLAKAAAGEANVPFFSISGSDFVEMYVGVGALRVRNLFKVAKQNSPCIIFIDEIDAVGRQRGAGLGGGHDEREQTLNQLLVEMDGFSPNLGIIIMAATNRPDVLDPALLRPGRFDRQVTISLPDVNGRTAILKVHSKNKKFEENINFENIAYRIPGFSGADIENLLNEAALLAARDNRKIINENDIDEGIDRVMMGPAKKSRKYTPEEKLRVAFHEAGHTVIGLKVEDSNVVQKITIIPRGQSGGYNLMVPKEETYFSTKESLLATITGYLGGRSSEEIALGSISNGAHNDFEIATKIARAMVTEYGMSNLGTVQYEKNQGSVFLGRDYLKEKDFSDQVALEIDREVRSIIDTCHDKARKTLKDNLELLCNITKYLLIAETINKSDIEQIYQTGKHKKFDEKLKSYLERLEKLTDDEKKKDVLTLFENIKERLLKKTNKKDETK